jgi:hypothetical protein
VLNLFINLGTDMYATVASSRGSKDEHSGAGEALGYLLPVIATSVGMKGQNLVARASHFAGTSAQEERRPTASSILGGVESAEHIPYDEDNMSQAETNIARHFWYFIVLFRYTFLPVNANSTA